jgi:hypothetical protein
MFDVNLSFSGLFAGCFGRSQKEEQVIDDYHLLKQALKKANYDTKIQLLLAKITNGKYHSSLLYKFIDENTMRITHLYGQIDNQLTNTFTTRNQPIMDGNGIVQILCVRSERMEAIEIPCELLDLLSDVVLNEKD